jgi:hypothetical protein
LLFSSKTRFAKNADGTSIKKRTPAADFSEIKHIPRPLCTQRLPRRSQESFLASLLRYFAVVQTTMKAVMKAESKHWFGLKEGVVV